MLVLNRKPHQEIVIDDQIVITVLGVQGNRGKLGIVGPTTVPVRRAELVPFPTSAAITTAPLPRARRAR